jgi:hypothetical protein
MVAVQKCHIAYDIDFPAYAWFGDAYSLWQRQKQTLAILLRHLRI